MERIIAYQVLKSGAVHKFDHTRPVEQWHTNYGCKTAVEECICFLKNQVPEWTYCSVERNIISALNEETGECVRFYVIGFVKSRQQFYHAKNRHDFKVPVMTQTEKDIFDKLQSVPNISGYIKSLIRNDIKSLR